jgi:hypothetical protein
MPVILATQEAEISSSKPDWANSFQDPISKNTLYKKRAGAVTQGVGLEFKTHTATKKKEKEKVMKKFLEWDLSLSLF